MTLAKKFSYQIAAFAVLYFLTARLGLAMSAVGGFATLVWPPAGISLAVLMIAGKRFWPGILLGAYITNLSVGAGILGALGIALGNTLEPLLACYLLSRAEFRTTMIRLKDVSSLAILGSGVSAILSASIGVISLWLSGKVPAAEFFLVWRTWWLGDATSLMILTPLILLWNENKKIEWRSTSLIRWAESVFTITVVTLVCLSIFGLMASSLIIRPYLLFPCLIWIALRYEQRITVSAIALISVLAIAATFLNHGPFTEIAVEDRLTGMQIFLGVGALTAMILSAILSEFKLAQAVSQEREEKYRSTTEAASDSIITIDQNSRILFANQIVQRVFGYAPEEMVGQPLAMIMPNRLRAGHDAGMKRFLTSGKRTIPWTGLEIVAQRKDGTEFPVEISFGEYRTHNGRAFTGVIRDIFERKRIERELIQAKEQAVVASQTKSAFLANMSHEIRTPLGAVLGFSEMIANENLTDEEREQYVESVRRNGLLLVNIINDILDLSKVEAGKIGIESKRTLWSEILSDLNHLLKEKAEAKGLRLDTKFIGAEPTAITTDALRLRQVLLNVVGNAIKFTDTGEVRVLMKLEIHGGKTLLRFDIEDSGPGLSSENAAKLFEPFNQADNSVTRKHGGTGLGLALSRNLAKALGGDLRLESSDVGRGSHFVLTVDPGEVSWESSPKPQALNLRRHEGLKGMNLILVEDSKDNQILVKHILEKAGANVQVADNGLEALEIIAGQDFDVILMDLQMPIMDGFRATAELRQAGYTKPIIALTAHALKEEREHSLASGFDEHICKPVDRELLIRTVSGFRRGDPPLNEMSPEA